MSQNYRAAKSGLGAETQAKIRQKYDPNIAHEMLVMIQEQTGESFDTSGDMDNFQNVLKDGVLLAKFANVLRPGAIKDTKPSKMVFKQMELINKALDEFKKLGIRDTDAFQSVDLTEAVNLHQVCICLQSIGRKCNYGPREAQENKREFTDEQMKAGQNVIGLQMGTNKGASQAGMNLGKHRMITDDTKQ